MDSLRQRLGALAALALLVLGLAGCQSKPLPEAESESVKTYVQTCGGCHVIYYPESFTAGMWKTIVDRMEREMMRRGRPLDSATKTEVLDYLQRNAGER